MSTTIKTIILNHLNSAEKATIKFVIASQTSIQVKLPYQNSSNLLLLIKTPDNIYKKPLSSGKETNITLSNMIDLDSKIALLIVEQNGIEQKPIFWGGTNCTNSIDCQNQINDNAYSDSENETLAIESPYSNLHSENPRNIDNEIKNQVNDLSNKANIALENNENNSLDKPIESAVPQFNIIKNDRINYFGENHTISNKPNYFLEDQFDFSDSDIEKEIDFNLSTCSNCANCKYKREFYQEKKMEQAQSVLNDIASLQSQEKSNNQPHYYSIIEKQYNELFEKFPPFPELSAIIPNSKWIKIDVDGDYYVLGLIYENSVAKYMCYGVPQAHKSTPPAELSGLSQWLPFDYTNPDDSGLWIMYQSAETGENIKVDVI